MTCSVSENSQNNYDDGAGDDYAPPVKHAISSPNSWSILRGMAKAFSIIISLSVIDNICRHRTCQRFQIKAKMAVKGFILG